MSPAQLTTGRQLRDGVPTAKQNYKVNPEWQQTLEERETQMAQRHEEIRQQSPGQRRRRRRLQPGARVWVQDQTSKAWSKSGTVVEVHPYRQYAVRMDGSGRISIRTRGHLKEAARQPEPPASPQEPEPPASPREPLEPPPLTAETPPPPRQPRHRIQPRWLEDYVTQ